MEANEAADTIKETVEEQRNAADERTRAHQEAVERFRRQAAIIIGVLAMLLAITALGGDQARTTLTNENIRASDTYAFYQAKNIRQTSYQLSANDLQALLDSRPDLPPAARAAIQARIAAYKATAARFEDDPSAGGTGKKQLLDQAHGHEDKRDRAERQEPNFNYGQALLQIAIVLGSVSIVATSRALLYIAIALGGVAVLFMLNGFFLFTKLPLT